VNLRGIVQSTRTWFADLTVGGAWARALNKDRQHNLHWFWYDGFFSSSSDNIVLNFISIYILSLGATEGQIGLMASFSSVAAALVLLPGAMLAERVVRKKNIPLFFGGFARLSILLLVFVPILFKSPAVVWVAIALAVSRDAFNNLGYPAWMAVANETVPIEGRGRYFGSRNFIMSITGMAATLLAGKLITVFVAPLGYQIAFGIAFVLGVSSTLSFARIHEEPVFQRTPGAGFSLRSIAGMLKGQPQFVAFTLIIALWNFGINVSGPFFNVQMVQTLNFSAASIGFLAVVISVTTLLSQNQIGALADRVGSRRLQLISMCLIPSLPLAWIFVTQVWHVVIINAVCGVIWGAFNLVSFNLLLALIPHNQVSRYSAVYQIVNMLALALGALAGSAIITRWGFIAVMLTSAFFRILGAGLFAKFIHEPPQTAALIGE